MNSTIDKQPNCIAQLQIEIPADRVGQEREKIVKQFLQFAQVPGYRAGKAPRMVVEAKFKAKINEQLESDLLSAGVREAISEHKLKVLGVQSVDDVKREPNGPLTFAAKVITAPEFELPEYKHLQIRAPEMKIEDKQVDDSLERLQQRLAEFEDVTGRELAMDDFCVLDVAGRVDGVPVGEVTAERAGAELQGRENFWIKMGPGNFLPDFCEALVGMSAGETREFSLELPMDFPVKELAARKIDYVVKLREIKKQVLPELDDAFAEKVAPGKTMTELRELVRTDLERQMTDMIEEGKRRQVLDQINGAVDFELPQHMVRSETQRIASDIIRQNQERGIADDKIVENQSEIATNAHNAAKERLKSAFVLTRIAAKEGIAVTKDEVHERVVSLAARYSTSVDKMQKDLEERDALSGIEEELLIAKTLAALTADATVLPLEQPAAQSA